MINYFAGITDNEGIREHPWTESESNSELKYYDFKKNPHLIRQVLEDFKPWDSHEAIQNFYNLLEWLNGDDSKFESNDCRFYGPTKNQQRDKWNKELLFHGGLMVLFTNLQFNISSDSRQWFEQENTYDVTAPLYQPNKYMDWFANRSIQLIGQINTNFMWGCLAVHLYPAFYANAVGEEPDKFGFQPAFEWWVWGNDEKEALENFNVIVDTISRCLKTMSEEVTHSTLSKGKK